MALFRHKQVRRFCIGEFEFKNFQLRIEDEEKIVLFKSYIEDPRFPQRDRINIVEVNEEAVAAAETPIGPQGILGTMQSTDILTAKDKARLMEQAGTGTNGVDPSKPTPAKPTIGGFGNLGDAFKAAQGPHTK